MAAVVTPLPSERLPADPNAWAGAVLRDSAAINEAVRAVQEEMMVAMLDALQGCGATCAAICGRYLLVLREEALKAGLDRTSRPSVKEMAVQRQGSDKRRSFVMTVPGEGEESSAAAAAAASAAVELDAGAVELDGDGEDESASSDNEDTCDLECMYEHLDTATNSVGSSNMCSRRSPRRTSSASRRTSIVEEEDSEAQMVGEALHEEYESALARLGMRKRLTSVSNCDGVDGNASAGASSRAHEGALPADMRLDELQQREQELLLQQQVEGDGLPDDVADALQRRLSVQEFLPADDGAMQSSFSEVAPLNSLPDRRPEVSGFQSLPASLSSGRRRITMAPFLVAKDPIWPTATISDGAGPPAPAPMALSSFAPPPRTAAPEAAEAVAEEPEADEENFDAAMRRLASRKRMSTVATALLEAPPTEAQEQAPAEPTPPPISDREAEENFEAAVARLGNRRRTSTIGSSVALLEAEPQDAPTLPLACAGRRKSIEGDGAEVRAPAPDSDSDCPESPRASRAASLTKKANALLRDIQVSHDRMRSARKKAIKDAMGGAATKIQAAYRASRLRRSCTSFVAVKNAGLVVRPAVVASACLVNIDAADVGFLPSTRAWFRPRMSSDDEFGDSDSEGDPSCAAGKENCSLDNNNAQKPAVVRELPGAVTSPKDSHGCESSKRKTVHFDHCQSEADRSPLCRGETAGAASEPLQRLQRPGFPEQTTPATGAGAAEAVQKSEDAVTATSAVSAAEVASSSSAPAGEEPANQGESVSESLLRGIYARALAGNSCPSSGSATRRAADSAGANAAFFSPAASSSSSSSSSSPCLRSALRGSSGGSSPSSRPDATTPKARSSVSFESAAAPADEVPPDRHRGDDVSVLLHSVYARVASANAEAAVVAGVPARGLLNGIVAESEEHSAACREAQSLLGKVYARAAYGPCRIVVPAQLEVQPASVQPEGNLESPMASPSRRPKPLLPGVLVRSNSMPRMDDEPAGLQPPQPPGANASGSASSRSAADAGELSSSSAAGTTTGGGEETQKKRRTVTFRAADSEEEVSVAE
eukprot:TRINITY_DN5681_c0_g1_i1.p1 TRINITY_DN5681_c0_g1~~TRINITY_DN5681_c0_g1_i1.p1  ORF type:complete len:1054 (+),score=217.56 TRINITY_DN5681_c0_g1_i1:555-3716(+)